MIDSNESGLADAIASANPKRGPTELVMLAMLPGVPFAYYVIKTVLALLGL